MKILYITCSTRADESQSYRFSKKIVTRLASRLEPTDNVTLILRDLVSEPLPHVDCNYAHALAGRQSNPMPHGSIELSDRLIDELESADAIVMASPMHNYTLPSSLKAWIDHVVRVGRTFDSTPKGKQGRLQDRPVYVVVASGGIYDGPKARQPDFFTPYLRAALGTIGITDLNFFPLQGMVMGDAQVDRSWADATAMLDRLLPVFEKPEPTKGVLNVSTS